MGCVGGMQNKNENLFYLVVLYREKGKSMIRVKKKDKYLNTLLCILILLAAGALAEEQEEKRVFIPYEADSPRDYHKERRSRSSDETHAPSTHTVEVEYNMHRSTIVPEWAPGVPTEIDGQKHTCFDNGVCRPVEDEESADPQPPLPTDPSAPPHVLYPPAPKPSAWHPDSFSPSTPESYAGEVHHEHQMHTLEELPPLAEAPLYRAEHSDHLVADLSHLEQQEHLVNLAEHTQQSSLAQQEHALHSELATGAFPFAGGPATGYGDGPTKDEVFRKIFSIGDEDKYLIIANVSLDLPLRTFIKSTAVTSEEVYAQDRKDYLAGELEGVGSTLTLDSGLNTIYSSKISFYIPRTALSLSVTEGRIVYPAEFVRFITSAFKIEKSAVFVSMVDTDGSKVYYTPLYNATVALPNPQTPIISQELVVQEGYGFFLLKAKRLEIDRGVIVLSEDAYTAEDLLNATTALRRFTSGETSNPFEEMTGKYYGAEATGEDAYSSESRKDESYSSESRTSSISDTKAGAASREEVSSSSSARRDEKDASSETSSASVSDLSSTARSSQAMRESADRYLQSERAWREKAAATSRKAYRKFALKKARKYARLAAHLEKEASSSALISARTGQVVKGSLITGSAAKSLSNAAATSLMSSQSRASWFSDRRKKNASLSRLVQAVSSAESASASASAYEKSTRQSVSASFSSNAASSIISAHQANEMYYKGVTAEEYASREMKQVLMGTAMQHALFSKQGRVYTSQRHVSRGVSSSKSSRKWLSRRVKKISTFRRYTRRLRRRFSRSASTSAAVAQAAAKEQAAARAAIASYRRASVYRRKAAQAVAMAKSASASHSTRSARSYRRKAQSYRRSYAASAARAARFAGAAAAFKKEKLSACSVQASIFARRANSPLAHVTEKELTDLHRTVVQMLTTSQIQLISRALTTAQVQVLSKMLTPLQVQQTLVAIGAMTPEQMQLLLIRLHMKSLELRDSLSPEAPSLDLRRSAYMPINTKYLNVMGALEGRSTAGMTEEDLVKYLLQGQFLLQAREDLLTPAQVEELKLRATAQTQMITRLLKQLEVKRQEMELQGRSKIMMESGVTACNPLFSVKAGVEESPFSGLSTGPALRMAGDLSLGRNSYLALRQLLCSPSVSGYIGVPPSALASSLYKQVQDRDIISLLAAAFTGSNPAGYAGMSELEKTLIRARGGAAERKMASYYGASFGRLEQAILSAYNLIRNASVKCSGASSLQEQVPNCQITPLLR